MKLSLRWLNEHVDLSGIDPEEVARQLTLKVAALDGVERPGRELADVRIALVKQAARHPDADRLSLCQVDTGSEVLEVVCGAPNVRGGQKICFAPVGATLPGGLKLERRKIRGVFSNGMICSEREMGLGDQHQGILVLPEDAPVGAQLVEYLGLDDVIFVLDNKDVTHRADLWGVYGFARELSAIFQRPLKELAVDRSLRPDPAAYPIVLEDREGCPQYLALLVEEVRGDAASPEWLARRLRSADLRPRHLLVDLSNYVMLEIGQPTHPFDRDALQGGIVVRRARAGETLQTLDGVERTLVAEDLLIADQRGGVAVAGILGGQRTEIAAGTRRMLLESAHFDAVRVRKSAGRLALRTDALARFEKFLDPSLAELALRRYAFLLRQLCPEARIAPHYACAGALELPPVTLRLRTERTRLKLGLALSEEEIRRHLTALGFGLEATAPGELAVTVPAHRAGRDMTGEDDLIEEVGRLAGYDRVPVELPKVRCAPPRKDPIRQVERLAVLTLVQESGYTEVTHYSFASERHQRLYHLPEEAFLRVLHPMSQEATCLRTSLVPALLESLAKNQLNRREVRLVEAGRAFLPRGSEQPVELRHLLAGRAHKDSAPEDLTLEVRSDAEGMLRRCGLTGEGRSPGREPAWALPGGCVELVVQEKAVALVGALRPALARAFDLDGHAALLWVDLEVLSTLPRIEHRMQPIPQFPPVWRDISVVAPSRVTVGELVSWIRAQGAEAVARVELFDVYRGRGIPDGHRSLAFRLEYRERDRTLTDQEVESLHSRVVKGLAEKGVQLRA